MPTVDPSHDPSHDPDLDRKLRGVDPDLARKVKAIIRDVAAHGHTLTVTEGKRSRARQAWLWASGRSRRGPILTKTMQSKHLTGRAVDLAPMEDGKVVWDPKHPAWALLARAAKAHGLTSGYHDWGWDYPHVELP